MIWPALILLLIFGVGRIYGMCYVDQEPAGRIADFILICVITWAIGELLRSVP